MLGEAAILMLAGVGVAAIGSVFYGVRHSRCTSLRCCWGLAACERDNMTPEEAAADVDPGEGVLGVVSRRVSRDGDQT